MPCITLAGGLWPCDPILASLAVVRCAGAAGSLLCSRPQTRSILGHFSPRQLCSRDIC